MIEFVEVKVTPPRKDFNRFLVTTQSDCGALELLKLFQSRLQEPASEFRGRSFCHMTCSRRPAPPMTWDVEVEWQ